MDVRPWPDPEWAKRRIAAVRHRLLSTPDDRLSPGQLLLKQIYERQRDAEVAKREHLKVVE